MPTSSPQFVILTNTDHGLPVPLVAVLASCGVGVLAVLGLFLNALFQRCRALPPDLPLPPSSKRYKLKLKLKLKPQASAPSSSLTGAEEKDNVTISVAKLKPTAATRGLGPRVSPLDSEAAMDVDTSLEIDDASDEEWD
jgi:hypothetical protein